MSVIFSWLMVAVKFIYPFRKDILKFAKKVYIYVSDKDEFTRIQLRESQEEYLKNKSGMELSKIKGKTTIYLIDILFRLTNEKKQTIHYKCNSSSDAEIALEKLKNIIKNTAFLKEENFIFEDKKVTCKKTQSTLLLGNIVHMKVNKIFDDTHEIIEPSNSIDRKKIEQIRKIINS